MNKVLNNRIMHIALLLLMTVFVFSPLFKGRVLAAGDLNDETVPYKYLIKESLLKGDMTVHDSGIGLGYPVYRSISAGVYSPYNLFLLLPLPVHLIVNLMILAALMLIVIGAYILMRYLSKSSESALLFAVIAGFSTVTLARMGHLAIITGLSFVPLFAYAAVRMIRAKNLKFMIYSVILFFFIASGGHPQYIFIVFAVFIALSFKRENLKIISVFTASCVMTTAVIWFPLLKLAAESGRSTMNNFIMSDIKSSLYMIFPYMHSKIAGGLHYRGPYNLYESYPYFTLLPFIIIVNMRKETVTRAVKSNKRLFITSIILIALSFVKVSGLGIFLTPVRYLQFGVILSLFILIRNYDYQINIKNTAISTASIAALIILMYLRGFNPLMLVLSIVLIILYIIVIFLVRHRNLSPVFLAGILFLDLCIVSSQFYGFEPLDRVRNISMPELKNSTVVTYVPEYYEFYIDYLKHNEGFSPELSKAYTTYGNRGVYYDCNSINIYNSLNREAYIDYFDDRTIMRGGFSNMNYILNPDIIKPQFIIVPDIPVIESIDDSLTISTFDYPGDSLRIIFTGQLSFDIDTHPANPEHSYLAGVDDMKAVYLNYTDSTGITVRGSGRILMITDKKGQAIHYPEFFEYMGFVKKRTGPFALMARPDSKENARIIFNPGEKVIVEMLSTELPGDLKTGIIISVFSILLLLCAGIMKRLIL
ncbi:MAG: hypothetical protein R6U31_07865 [bacterium]